MILQQPQKSLSIVCCCTNICLINWLEWMKITQNTERETVAMLVDVQNQGVKRTISASENVMGGIRENVMRTVKLICSCRILLIKTIFKTLKYLLKLFHHQQQQHVVQKSLTLRWIHLQGRSKTPSNQAFEGVKFITIFSIEIVWPLKFLILKNDICRCRRQWSIKYTRFSFGEQGTQWKISTC